MRTRQAIVPALLPLAQRFLHFCLPNCCLWCDFAVQQPAAQLCDYCQAALPRLHWPAGAQALHLPAVRRGLQSPLFDAVWSLSWYQQPWSHFISAWKLQQDLACGVMLRQQLARALPDWALHQHYDAISYVPMHRKRLRERGFNQSRQLAMTVARCTNLPLLDLFLAQSHLPHQLGASASARRAQLRRQFRLQPAVDDLPSRILLVDDVLTTGATLNQLSRLLRKAGVPQIGVVTLAITPAPGVSTTLYSSPSPLSSPESNNLPK
ncbi:MAG: phosphoribosyltransferase family protein [Rheinheimera sp.]|nr:phosphoribosyltransferase family protein [Rheinheimera sp.]